MNPEESINNPKGEKTEELLGQTVDSNAHSREPDATRGGSDSESESFAGSSRFREAVGDWIGPYQLLEQIGSGGMGTVYRAEQTRPVKRQVALKIIKAGMDTNQVIARFEAERQALSMMEHAHIARVLDAGATDTGRPYFVMELVRGESVTRFCDRQKMPIEDRLRLFCRICDAVQHAHQKGIIHRDLKPSNILVSLQDGKAVPKIIDFGVAKATNQRLTEKTMYTQQGQVLGTLEYMSPEQAQMTDANVDTRTDIYSLGVVLYELLTGNTPLNRQSISRLGYLDILNRIKDLQAPRPSSRLTESTEKLQAIAESRSIEPRRLSGQLRGDLDWIVLKALDKDPARRYETAAGFADDIEHYLNAEPIDARPPDSWYLLGKFVRRHKIAVAAGASMLAVLLAGIVLITSQWLRAEAAETELAQRNVNLQKSLELEKDNVQLQRELAKKNEAARAELQGEIEILAGFGRWKEMLERMETYQQRFGVPSLEVSILRLDALDGLSRTRELRAEIERLESHPQAASRQAQLDLWRGYVVLSASDNGSDARSLIRSAIDSGGLEPANEWFARGLIDDSLASCVECYGKALEISPFHSQARMQMIVSMIMLGRYDEVQQQLTIAQTMFPNDLRYRFAEVASHSFADKRLLAARTRRQLRQQAGRDRLGDIVALDRLSAAVNEQFRSYDRDGLLDWFAIMRQGLPLLQESSYRAIPVAEFQKERLFSAYGQLANCFLNPLLRIAREKKKHREIIKNCQSAWKIHEDGMFKCFEAWSWFALQDYVRSAEAFALAAESDGLFPEIRNQGIYGGFISHKMLFDQTADRDQLERAMNYLEQYVTGRFESHRAETMFEASAEAGRWDLTRRITEEMIKREGGLISNWSMILLNEAEERENFGLALSVCDEMLDNAPENTALQKRRLRIVQKIAGELDADLP
jgi:serine/threonine protein kinase